MLQEKKTSNIKHVVDDQQSFIFESSLTVFFIPYIIMPFVNFSFFYIVFFILFE